MANLAPTQIEQLQSIGAYLRQVRQDQGLSLDVLANQIFIRPALLQALETGHDAQLPEPVFIQGFIRRYAEALGLDGKAISQEFVITPAEVVPTPVSVTPTAKPPAQPATSTRSTASADPSIPAPVPVAAPVSPPEPAPVQVMEKPRPVVRPSTDPSFAFPLWLALGAGALLVGGLLWAVLGRDPDPARVTTPPDPTEAVDPSAETEPEAAPIAVDPEPEPEPPVALEAPIVVTISLRDRAWMSVVADGRTVYEGTSEQGYEETWTAQNSLVFRTGNAGGVALSVNGGEPVVLGQSGVVRTVTLSPDSNADTLR